MSPSCLVHRRSPDAVATSGTRPNRSDAFGAEATAESRRTCDTWVPPELNLLRVEREGNAVGRGFVAIVRRMCDLDRLVTALRGADHVPSAPAAPRTRISAPGNLKLEKTGRHSVTACWLPSLSRI